MLIHALEQHAVHGSESRKDGAGRALHTCVLVDTPQKSLGTVKTPERRAWELMLTLRHRDSENGSQHRMVTKRTADQPREAWEGS